MVRDAEVGSDEVLAHAMLSRLVEQGWVPPSGPGELADHDDFGPDALEVAGLDEAVVAVAVRSLAEDLAVAKLRAGSARESSGRGLERVQQARGRSHELQMQNQRHQVKASRELARRTDSGAGAGSEGFDAVASLRTLTRSADGLETTSAVVNWALDHIAAATGTDAVAVTLTGLLRANVTDGLAEEAERLQVELGEGPTVTASTRRTTVWTSSDATSPWPRWSAAAAQAGITGVITVPLASRGGPGGSLTLHSATTGALGADQVQAAQAAGALLSLCLAHAHQTEHLHTAMDRRTLIGQAQGLIMERYDLDADTAFDVLRRASNTRHQPLYDVANASINRRVRL